jgi:hypothetical protein
MNIDRAIWVLLESRRIGVTELDELLFLAPTPLSHRKVEVEISRRERQPIKRQRSEEHHRVLHRTSPFVLDTPFPHKTLELVARPHDIDLVKSSKHDSGPLGPSPRAAISPHGACTSASRSRAGAIEGAACAALRISDGPPAHDSPIAPQ